MQPSSAVQSYVFEITAANAPGFRVSVELSGEHTLDDLHQLIVQHFGFAAREPYFVYRSGRAFDQRTEYGGPQTDSERPAHKTLLSRLALRAGMRILHVQGEGIGERQSMLLARIGASDPGAEGVRTLEVTGVPPPAIDPEQRNAALTEWQIELAELADELREMFDGFDNDDLAPRTEDDVAREAELASRIGDWAQDLDGALQLLELDSECELTDWLLNLPHELAEVGRVDDAIEIAGRFAKLTEHALFASELGLLLAGAERADDAKRTAEDNLRRFPRDEWVALQAAETFNLAGDAGRAEQLLRHIVATTKHVAMLGDASDSLAELLRASDRADEAQAVLANFVARRDPELAQAEQEIAGNELEILRKVEQDLDLFEGVERNDPCPCGSGKKYKKCHGVGQARVESELDIFSRLFEDVVSFATREPASREAGAALALFAGAEFADLSIPEALPLFADQSVEEAFVQWWVLDFAGERGSTAVQRYSERKRHEFGRREREVLQRMQSSFVGLFSLDEIREDGRYVLRDALDPGAAPFPCRPLGDAFDGGVTIAGRVVDFDGKAALLPGALAFVDGAALIARCRAEYASWLATHSSGTWSSFFKSHGQLFHRTFQESRES
jgi:tetratricopeptide (TPR) repeat protein